MTHVSWERHSPLQWYWKKIDLAGRTLSGWLLDEQGFQKASEDVRVPHRNRGSARVTLCLKRKKELLGAWRAWVGGPLMEALKAAESHRLMGVAPFSSSHFCKVKLNSVFKAALNPNTSQRAREPPLVSLLCTHAQRRRMEWI